MKRCLSCEKTFEAAGWQCPHCGARPPQKDGIELFAPALAAQNDLYNPADYDALYAVEAGNFWFRARNALIVKFIRKYFPGSANFMEVGCGTGFVLAGLSRAFPALKLTGTEIFSEGLSFAAARMPANTELYQMDGRKIPFRAEFDLIGAFDCLEHIDEDEAVLAEINLALKPGGGVIFTVPQHPFMWSTEDDTAHHKRRYTRTELQEKMKRAGFDIVATTSFVTLLFPFMMVERLLAKRRKKQENLSAGLRLPKFINSAFACISSLEVFLLGLGLRFPFGGSRLVLGRKK
ncbi:MAG: methyltransferase domain-containing protein [Alphaproteobacteria bacterium]